MAKHARRTTERTGGAWLLLLAASGCTKSFAVRPVDPAKAPYAASETASARAFSVTDARADRTLHTGTMKVQLDGVGDELAFFAANVAAVLKARGIDVTYDTVGTADTVLTVRSYRYRNLRTTGFSPYHTFATFSADLTSGGQTHRLVAFFKNSKTPMWTFNEVERPCYQIPTDVLVNEIAAKMNRHVFGRVASDQTVEQIAASIDKDDADASSEQYLKVLALGYTNNPAAVRHLVGLLEHDETLMRAAAASALGTLGAADQMARLEKLYASSGGVVKVMAAKAIADLGTPESRAFVERVRQSKEYRDEELSEVLELY